MCLAIPARIESISGPWAQVEVLGVRKPIGLQLTPEARVGDYVLIHTGYAIGVIDEAEAEKTVALLKDLFSEEGS